MIPQSVPHLICLFCFCDGSALDSNLFSVLSFSVSSVLILALLSTFNLRLATSFSSSASTLL